jgi:hypothetical protein
MESITLMWSQKRPNACKSQEHKEHTNKLSLKSLSGWSGFGTWRGFNSFDLCLGVNALALVLNENLEKLGCLEWRWLGVFIALNHQTTVGVATVDGRPERQPRHPTVRVLELLTVGGFVL